MSLSQCAYGLSPDNQAYKSHTEEVFILERNDLGFVGTSGPCKKNKCPQRHARAETTTNHTGAYMERVYLDFLGLF